MQSIEFSQNDLKSIRYERFHHPDPRVARRMEILSLKAAGFRHREIAKAAGVSRSTIQRLLNLFGKAGLEGVREFHEQGPTSALAEHAASLGEEFRLRPPSSSAEAAKRIELLTGISRQPTQVRAFLKQTLGLSWRKTAAVPLPPKKTLQEHVQTQDIFLK